MNEEPLIQVEALRHTFGEGEAARTVLKGVSVQFYPGEIVIVMGPSGAGKTTLLTLAGALRSVQSGQVRVAGVELNGATARSQLETRRRIGYIFQHHNLLESLTIRENVQLGLACRHDLTVAEARRLAEAMLVRVGLADHLRKRPSALSGGQRQRVAIARALVREPSIILADEPTAALDSQSGREVVALLQKLAREQACAILLVTHDDRILDVADRILVLEDGCLEENNLVVERLKRSLADGLRAVAGYPALFVSGGAEGRERKQRETAEAIAEGRRKVNTLASRRLKPELAEEMEALDQALDRLAQVERDAHGFLARYVADPALARVPSADALFQSLEFLLLTAADALASGDPEERDRLAVLTSDRGSLMESLRARNGEAMPSASEETRQAFFDLTLIFARLVHFLHALAASPSG